ncbi:MAG: UDP-N-acetylmuramoyl-tripeptide--D-alanyl-D-alanine ligase [Clostridia bacterium]|nr:UDP-N-acetylmuramoyl-tripeptide--D-alanyl-D-alanine ligase [Clostridia bacterium]
MELTIARAVLLICCAANFIPQSLYYTHMLQLNSYRNERYWKWCQDNDKRLVSVRTLLPALLLPAMYLPELWCLIASSAVLLLTAVLNIPKKAKKPLVFTARVKRLLTTLYILLAAVLVVCWFVSHLRCVGIILILSVQIWPWLFVANTVNLPLEKHIANGYVKDARRRLREMPDLTVIGVTGSYGKTSTKTCLQALLSVRYNVLMTPESYNTTMGVVRTIRERLRPSHEIFIAEMGAKNPGDIREICELVSPRYGVITSIGEQHLETFKTVDNIVATKFELADALPADGRLFACGDNEYIRTRLTTHAPACPVTTYGFEVGDVKIRDIQVDATGTSFTVTVGGESQRFVTHLLGAHMIQNLAGCIAVAVALDIPLEELVYPVRRLKPIEHRLQLLPNGFIDDAYNSNPAGFRSALDVLSGFEAQRVLVTPGMVELGEKQESLNRELGTYAADKCDIAILVGERQAPPLKEGLLAGGFPEENLHVVPTLTQGLALLASLPVIGNRIVLLENDLPDNF